MLLAPAGPFFELHRTLSSEAEESMASLTQWINDGQDASLLELVVTLQQTIARNMLSGILTVLGHVIEYSAFLDNASSFEDILPLSLHSIRTTHCPIE